MLERCGALRIRQARANIRNGALEKALGRGPVAFLSRGDGVGHEPGCFALLYSHRSAVGESRVRGRVGNVDLASTRPEKKRPPQ